MKNFKLKRLLGLALIGGLTALNATTAFAASGDTISNTATLNFDVGGVAQTAVPSNTASFVEDRKINFIVAEVGLATTSVVPGATLQVQTFTVTNTGNAPQDFLLTALEVGVNPFSPTAVQVFVDSAAVAAGTDTFLSGTDTGIFIDELPAGVARTVYIVSTIPVTATNGQVATMALVAQVATGGAVAANETAAANAGAAITNDDNSHISPAGTYSNGATAVAAGVAATVADSALTVQTVFADPAGTLDSAGAADVLYNGQASANDTYTVSAAALTVTKAVTVLWDPVNGGTSPKAIPGAYMQYTVTVSNAGPAAAVLTTLSDALQAAVGSLDLDPNLILATATTPVPAAVVGVDIESAPGAGIRINTAAGVGAGTARASAGLSYCTGDAADADADGCSYTGGAGGTLSITFSDPVLANPNIAGMAIEAGYAEGELLSGESVDIVFNAIVQ